MALDSGSGGAGGAGGAGISGSGGSGNVGSSGSIPGGGGSSGSVDSTGRQCGYVWNDGFGGANGQVIITYSSYQSSTANAVTVAINPIIAITDGNSGTTTLGNITPTGAGRMSTKTDALSVTTNDVGGYTVTINMSGASNNLVSGSNNLLPTTGTTSVGTTQPTLTSPSILTVGSGTAAPTSAWGFCFTNNTVPAAYTVTAAIGACDVTNNSVAITAGKYVAVPVAASPFTMYNTSVSSVGTYTTTVTFGVAVNNGQASGTYTGTVVFTAIAT